MKPPAMPTQEIIIIILIGLAAGVLSGLVGIGGGIILVPILVFFLGYTQYQAQGTSLAVLLLPVGILAFLNYYNECKKIGTPIDMRIVGLLAAGFVIGALGGSEIAGRINKDLLKKIFAIVLFYTAIKMMNWDVLIFRWVKSIF
jgi:uncharacterized protein